MLDIKKNPNKKEETPLRDPKEILEEISELDNKSKDLLKGIKESL